MIDDVSAVIPHAIAVEIAAPSPALPPAGESTLAAPTSEQVQMADRVFAVSSQPHPAAALFGVLTSAYLLRDLAVDTFTTSDEEQETEKKPDEDKDADPAR